MNAKAYCITDKKYCKKYIDALFPVAKWLAGITVAITIFTASSIIFLKFSSWKKAGDIALTLIFLLINNIFLSAIFLFLHLPYYNSVKERKLKKIQYVFSDNCFQVITFIEDDILSETKDIDYEALIKISKRKNKIILFKTRFSIYLIERKNFEGDFNQLYSVIKEHIENKKSGS